MLGDGTGGQQQERQEHLHHMDASQWVLSGVSSCPSSRYPGWLFCTALLADTLAGCVSVADRTCPASSAARGRITARSIAVLVER